MTNAPKSFLANLFTEDPDTVKTTRYVDVDKTQETGMDRLRRMYSLDKYGNQSKEILMISQIGFISVLGGGIAGGIIQSRDTFVNFIQNNQATKFDSHIDAKRKLQREMFLAFSQGGLRWAWRIGMFTMTFSTLMTTVSVYHGKESMVDYLVAGGVTGGLFRMNMGLKGTIAGSLLGTVLGGIAGTLSLLVLKVGGVSMDEMRDFSKLLYDTRESRVQEKLKAYMLKEHTDLQDRPGDEKGFVNLQTDEETEN